MTFSAINDSSFFGIGFCETNAREIVAKAIKKIIENMMNFILSLDKPNFYNIIPYN
jgi:hypothetical protein